MKRDDVLTKSQDQRLKAETHSLNEKALAALEKLATLPEVKNMITEVALGSYGRGGGKWGHLSLTKKGLVESTGFIHVCACPSDCTFDSWGGSPDQTDDPKKVKPSMRLVEEYFLTKPELDELIAKLKA